MRLNSLSFLDIVMANFRIYFVVFVALSLIVELAESKKKRGGEKKRGGRRRRAPKPKLEKPEPKVTRQVTQPTSNKLASVSRTYNVHTMAMNTRDEDRSEKFMLD
ncbi:uncharacterized protein LOC144744634 isoform X2 [Ciona intestinalis]